MNPARYNVRLPGIEETANSSRLDAAFLMLVLLSAVEAACTIVATALL